MFTVSHRLPGNASSRVALLAVAVLASAVVGCGEKAAALAYRRYGDSIDPLLEQESDRWRRVAEFQKDRQDDPALPRYYRYLRETSVPFYEHLHEQLAAIVPADERLAATHALLLRFSDQRLEFVHSELAAEDVHRRALQNGGLVALFSGHEEAEGLRNNYLRAVDRGVPDAKLTELYKIVDGFKRRYFEPMQEGVKDADEVQLRLRNSVIPALEELSLRKYGDDPPNQLLRECVGAWLEWHRTLAAVCPVFQEAVQARNRSQSAAEAAEKTMEEFRKALLSYRREL